MKVTEKVTVIDGDLGDRKSVRKHLALRSLPASLVGIYE